MECVSTKLSDGILKCLPGRIQLIFGGAILVRRHQVREFLTLDRDMPAQQFAGRVRIPGFNCGNNRAMFRH